MPTDIVHRILYTPIVFRILKCLVHPLLYPRVLLCRWHYTRTISRIRTIAKTRPLRVLFLVGEPAKWKCQALYEAMQKNKFFDPVIGLTAWNSQSSYFCSENDLEKQHAAAKSFFVRLGDKCIRTYTNFPRKGIPLSKLHPDIVFFSEPWLPIKTQTPEKTANAALCCFIPYFVPSTGNTSIVCEEDVHRYCHTHFTLSDTWSEYYSNRFTWLNNVQRFVGTGLPALDYFSPQKNDARQSNMIIYAPHHSIPNPKNTIPWNISTFDWSGRPILEYAKKHPEFDWVFKPHPLLKHEVTESGFMSETEINNYYEEWSKIGIVCQDGDYQGLFINSFAMITDCGSFLSEYGATGHPLIRLIRNTTKTFPPPPGDLLDSYYKVRNLDEMRSTFINILENRSDPMKETRIAAVKKAGLINPNSSERIIRYLSTICGILPE